MISYLAVNKLKARTFVNRTIILGLFIILPAFGCATNAQSQQEPIGGKSIVMFGNSITFQGKWEEVLNRKDVANCGIPGYTTGQLIWTIKNVFKDYPGTKIWFLEGGINDISLGVPVDRIVENQVIVIDSLKRNHIIPVVQSTILKYNSPDDNNKVNAVNKKLKKYCEQHQVDYIDLNEILSSNGELRKELTTDGCHLKPQAYIPWAEKVSLVLKKYNF